MRAALAGLLLLAVALPARADEAEEARAHYQAGQRHYDEGRYNEAIVEFKKAYALKPHPNVLYNIGQAYERLIEYPRSVEWFERYLAEAPPDAEFRTLVKNRLRVLRELPARVSIATVPEHVTAVLSGGGRSWEAETPTQFTVPAGSYRLELKQPGWEPETDEIKTEIGQPYFYQYRLERSTTQLSIFTRPRGARVFIDDKLVGETPFAGQVEVGTHRLLLEHKDYPWHRQEVTLKRGEPTKIERRLTRPVRSGRTELVLASMAYGGLAGPLLVASVSTNSDFLRTDLGLTTLLLSSAAGLGAGFLASFLPTRDGIKVGHSSIIIGSGAWGTMFGASLAMGLDLSNQFIYGLSLLGGALGLTTGVLIARYADIMPGTSAIVNSGAMWGTAAGALLARAIFDQPGLKEYGWFLFGGTTLGLLTGSLLAWKLDRSRLHVFLVDVGGVVGGGLGFALGAAVGASTNSDIPQSGARYALGGMALGLLAAAVGTRSYSNTLPPVEALFISTPEKRFALGIPKFDVAPALTPLGTATQLTLTLAKGRF
jgi:hypothetical protein